MYGPKSMQQKNANSDISTNSIRLEPLDVTSIHLMKSLNRVNSAPASLNNDMSMESIGNTTTKIIIVLTLILHHIIRLPTVLSK